MAIAPPSSAELDRPIYEMCREHQATLHTDQTVAAALESLRSKHLAEKIVYFYVLDADSKLVGVVPTRRLLMAQPTTKVSSLMVKDVVTVPTTATVREVYQRLLAHRFLALPVVDDEGHFVGAVDASDLSERAEILTWQAADDVFQLIGIHLAAARSAAPGRAFRERFPWLLCNIVGGIACALLAGLYEDTLGTAIVLALFIPVVLALSESVSIQSMTITIQGLHTARAERRSILPALAREFWVAWLLGLGCGGVVGLFAGLWKGTLEVALAIGCSILFSMVTACMLGVALPMVVRAFLGDPKIAAGPIVLATADLITLLLYFNLAMILV